MNWKSFTRCICAIIIALALSLASFVPNQAMTINRKLSGDMPDFGDVYSYKISPNGEYVVFCADWEAEYDYEVFSVPIAGGEPVKLTDMAEVTHYTDCSDPANYQISADSQWVVYKADLEENDKNELFRVPITGGTTTKLNATLVEDGDVYEFNITPQSIPPYGYIVVYLADQDEDDTFELYGVSITTGEGGKYNGDLVEDGNVHSFKISPDGQWVVYLADQETNQVYELYSHAIVGGDWEKLNDPITYPGYVQEFIITPNSQGVVYTSNPDGILGKMQLYSNYITGLGDGPYELSDLTFDEASVSDFDITPNSLGVVYIADQETDKIDELFSNYITGGTPMNLSGDLDLDGEIISFAITPNSQGVVFIHKNTSEMEVYFELYSNIITGGYSPKNLGTGISNITPNPYAITNNSLGVVYMADQETEDIVELFSNIILGGWVKKINGTLGPDGDVSDFLITPNSKNVIYIADQDINGQVELYINSILGGKSSKLNGPLIEDGNVAKDFRLLPNGKAIIYRADQEIDKKYELYISYITPATYLPLISNPESR